MSETTEQPPQWYVAETAALLPEAWKLFEDARSILDRYAQLKIEVNAGTWSRVSDEPGADMSHEQVRGYGMGELVCILSEVCARMDELELDSIAALFWLRECGVPQLASLDGHRI